jgi:Domain of unknown function (DUF222)
MADLQTEWYLVLAEIRAIDETEGKSERNTSVSIAQLSRSSPKSANAEVRLATKVAALPEVGEALRTGAISVGQLDAVTTIATPETQAETILLAQQSSVGDLERAAAVRRGKLAEERQKVQKERFLSFKKQGDQTVIRGSLPYLEGSEMEKQLRKIADHLYLGQADRPTPSARMLDALLIFMKYNPSNSYAESVASPIVVCRTTGKGVHVRYSHDHSLECCYRNRELRKRATHRPSPATRLAVRRNTRSATP